MRDHVVRMLDYNDNVNRRCIEAIQSERPAAERVAKVFSHILNAHRIWNARIGGNSTLRNAWEVSPKAQWGGLNQENFARSIEIADGPLDRVVDYQDLSGTPHRNTVFDILTHVVNHSTYHRGQLAILFGNEQKQPPKTDFIVYIHDAERDAALGKSPT